MLTYRRMVWLTIVVVAAAVIGFPAHTLYNHWCAVKAIERLGNYEMQRQVPWWDETINQPWYSDLFGKVVSLRSFRQTVHLGHMRDFAKLRGLKWLSFNEGTDDAWHALPRQIDYLDVRLPETGLDSAAWGAIGRLQHLKHLCLRGEPPSEIESAHVPPGTPATGEVQFHQTPVTVATIERILALRALSELSFHDTDLTDDGVEMLSRHPRIAFLDLQDNRALTDACLIHLARMPALKVLYIRVTPPEGNVSGEPPPIFPSNEGLERLRKLRPDMSINEWHRRIGR